MFGIDEICQSLINNCNADTLDLLRMVNRTFIRMIEDKDFVVKLSLVHNLKLNIDTYYEFKKQYIILNGLDGWKYYIVWNYEDDFTKLIYHQYL